MLKWVRVMGGGEIPRSFSLNEREIVSVYMLARKRGMNASKIMEKLARNFDGERDVLFFFEKNKSIKLFGSLEYESFQPLSKKKKKRETIFAISRAKEIETSYEISTSHRFDD